jgi:hypothetical protein
MAWPDLTIQRRSVFHLEPSKPPLRQSEAHKG